MKLSELPEMLGRWRAANPEAARRGDKIRRDMVLDVFKTFCFPTQSQAADLIGVHPGTISRAVAAGKIATNGAKGRDCRINPVSLWEYYKAP